MNLGSSNHLTYDQWRGGYFFHIGKSSDEVYEIYDFEGNLLVKTSKLLDLINHISGCIYSDEIYKICQEDINLRNDPWLGF